MSPGQPITLKEVQLRLGAPQHVLIHLCEKGVIEPDFTETSGRGKRREFSERNVFEFGVALALRKAELPVATAGFVVRVLRSFGRAVGKARPGFELPGSLVNDRLGLELHLYDDDRVVLSGHGGGLGKRLILNAKGGRASSGAGARVRVEKLDELPADYEVRVSVDLARIARRIFAEGP